MDAVQKVKLIGKTGECSEEEFAFFLPNYPTLHGSEFIFTIGWANSQKYIYDEIEFFIKGLHIIEEKYKEKASTDFGFGSPSPTSKLIDSLAKVNRELAEKSKAWVSANGGNYYIMKNIRQEKLVNKPGNH